MCIVGTVPVTCVLILRVCPCVRAAVPLHSGGVGSPAVTPATAEVEPLESRKRMRLDE